jgi:hypothetical protein
VKISLASAGVSQKTAKKEAPSLQRTNPNPLDSNPHIVERGKERLLPKKKKPTKLRKIIEAERGGAKTANGTTDGNPTATGDPSVVVGTTSTPAAVPATAATLVDVVHDGVITMPTAAEPSKALLDLAGDAEVRQRLLP